MEDISIACNSHIHLGRSPRKMVRKERPPKKRPAMRLDESLACLVKTGQSDSFSTSGDIWKCGDSSDKEKKGQKQRNKPVEPSTLSLHLYVASM